MHFDACAAQGGKEIHSGKLLAKRQTQRLQTFIEGRDRVVADAGDVAVAQIHGGQRLQNVVELAGGEVDGEILIAMDASGVLEVSHAILVEHDPLDWQATAASPRLTRGLHRPAADRSFLSERHE